MSELGLAFIAAKSSCVGGSGSSLRATYPEYIFEGKSPVQPGTEVTGARIGGTPSTHFSVMLEGGAASAKVVVRAKVVDRILKQRTLVNKQRNYKCGDGAKSG